MPLPKRLRTRPTCNRQRALLHPERAALGGTVRNRRPEVAAGSSRGLAGIVLVDDQYKVLSGLREFIDQTSDLVVVAVCRCADGAMAAVQQYRPQVVILDVPTARYGRVLGCEHGRYLPPHRTPPDALPKRISQRRHKSPEQRREWPRSELCSGSKPISPTQFAMSGQSFGRVQDLR
jgi:hypothetical protein